MSFRDPKTVIENAKGNAKYFNRNYRVFSDTSGNWRSEREATAPKNLSSYYYVVTPEGTVTTVNPPHTPSRLVEAGLTMDKIAPVSGTPDALAVTKAIADEVRKAKTIYDAIELLTECLGSEAGSHLFNLADALEVKVAKRVKDDLATA